MPEIVINESLIDRQQSFSGWIYSEEDAHFGAAFPDKLLIPRSDWRDVFEENEELEADVTEWEALDRPPRKVRVITNWKGEQEEIEWLPFRPAPKRIGKPIHRSTDHWEPY